MIIAIVQFDLPDTVTLEKATELFEASAPRYKDLAGLKRKQYLYGEGVGGGVYFWNSREEANALYTDEWKAGIKERFGTAPVITYFETPVKVINDVLD